MSELAATNKQAEDNIEKAEEFVHELTHAPATSRRALKELECPVCLTDMKPPLKIWECSEGHQVCANCIRPQRRNSPICLACGASVARNVAIITN